ncbi:Phosphoglycolate phosphatase 2 [Glycine soja]
MRKNMLKTIRKQLKVIKVGDVLECGYCWRSNGKSNEAETPFSFSDSSSSSMSPQPLSPLNCRDLFDSLEAFLFDCDGVIWKGDELIDGVPQTLEMLRAKGKKLVFVTNNSLKSRSQYAEKFRSLGISVSQDEIFSSSFAAAMYLKVNNFPSQCFFIVFPDFNMSSPYIQLCDISGIGALLNVQVYVIGGEGILEELRLAGIAAFGGPGDANKTINLKQNCFVEYDKSVGAVVVGIDPNINYYKLQSLEISLDYCPQQFVYIKDLYGYICAGCMVAAICGSTQKEPVVAGKPSTFMMEFLLKKFNVSCSKLCTVGDRLDTDVLFGQNAGCKTLLVLSGCTTQSALQDP